MKFRRTINWSLYPQGKHTFELSVDSIDLDRKRTDDTFPQVRTKIQLPVIEFSIGDTKLNPSVR